MKFFLLNSEKLIINDIKFKNEEIKQKYENKFKELILYCLNNEKYLKAILRGKNGYFFEKQLILDIITEKINKDKVFNFQEFTINMIYCMNTDKIDVMKY